MPRHALQPGTEPFYRALNPWVLSANHQAPIPDWLSAGGHDVKTYFDIWYIPRGSGAVRIDGVWHPFGPGDLVTIKPGEAFQRERSAPGDPFESYYFFVLPFGKRANRDDAALARRWPTKMSFKYSPAMRDWFRELFETYTTRPPGHALRLKSFALLVLNAVLGRLGSPTQEDFPPAYPQLLAAREFIERHFAEPIALHDIAAHAGLSSSYLSGLFKRHFDTSPVDYLIDYRIRTARMLLAEGLSVTDTAEQAGFGSLYYFSRVFANRVGMSPSRYAASCKSH
ncbi:MAG: AraC family transcriptional regulator [Candidatus Hydrogenedentes bacterium]|nr:AraC family transcriptional regulator [Candidatus Hydrogenedentota bacterium]